MKLIGLIMCALAVAPAVAAGQGAHERSLRAALTQQLGPDHVYVYRDGQNTNYQCDTFLAYFDTEGGSVLYADNCAVTSTDTNNWPFFVPQPIYLSLDFQSARLARVMEFCLFVAHAQNPDRTTSTVIDCRSAATQAER